MVLLCYEKNMSMDRHHILKSSKKNDKLDIVVLNNSNVFKENNTNSTFDEDFNIPVAQTSTKKSQRAQSM